MSIMKNVLEKFVAFSIIIPVCHASDTPCDDFKFYQNNQINCLLRLTKQNTLKIANSTSANIKLDVLYAEHLKDIADGAEVQIHPPSHCYYIEFDGFDDLGNPVAKKHFYDEYRYTFKAGSREETANLMYHQVMLEAGKISIIPKFDDCYIARLKLLSPQYFLHIEKGEKGCLLTIQDKPKISYPLPMGKLNLFPMPLNSSIRTINLFHNELLPEEGFSSETYRGKLQQLYNIWTERPLTLEAPRIPLVVHSIWPTLDNLPTLFSGRKQLWLIETLRSLPQQEGWQHHIWVPNVEEAQKIFQTHEADIPDLIKRRISFKSYKSLKGFRDQYIIKLSPAHVSKVLRFHILNENGGIFRGTDVEVVHSLRVLNGTFDSYFGLDVSGTFPTTSLMASIAGHPIMQEAIKIIDRNLTPESKPAYLKKILANENAIDAKVDEMILGFDSGVLAIAIMNSMRHPQRLSNIVLPSIYFNPKRNNQNIFHLDDSNQQWGIDTLAIHYREYHWK